MGKKYKQQDISSGYITCTCCNQSKSLESYYFAKGYYSYRCKECRKKKYIELRGPLNKKLIVIKDGKKKCNNCGEDKELCEYRYIKKYYSGTCKKCEYLVRKEKKKLTEEEELFKKGFKKCKTCQNILPFEKFPNKTYVKLYSGDCSACKSHKNKSKESYKEYQRRWRQSEQGKLSIKRREEKKSSKNREIVRLIREERIRQKEIINREKEERRRERELKREMKLQEENRVKLERQRLMEYYKSDEWKKIKQEKDRIKSYERWKNKWKNDELFAMKVRIRNLIRNTFRKSGHTKPEKRTEKILGCNYELLKLHLESQFIDGMCWDNRGEWHIDHIIPLSSAKTLEELIKLSHYTNLQPLWGVDNIKKGNKY